MYDPLVVDTFIRKHHELTPEQPEIAPKSNGLTAITKISTEFATGDGSQNARLSEITAST